MRWRTISEEGPPDCLVLYRNGRGAEVQLAFICYNTSKPGWQVLANSWEFYVWDLDDQWWCPIPEMPERPRG